MNIKRLNDKAIIPTKGSEDAAGYDLYACVDDIIVIHSGETIMIPTGLAMAIPNGFFGGIFARSGLATKKGLAPANKVGVVDADYRGEVMVALHNHSDKDQTIMPSERIAQLVLIPFGITDLNIVDNLDETERGTGGFGSTGTN